MYFFCIFVCIWYLPLTYWLVPSRQHYWKEHLFISLTLFLCPSWSLYYIGIFTNDVEEADWVDKNDSTLLVYLSKFLTCLTFFSELHCQFVNFSELHCQWLSKKLKLKKIIIFDKNCKNVDQGQPWEYLTIYRFAIVVSFSK